jgi:hypothetical protein
LTIGKNEQSGIVDIGFFCKVKSPAICGGDRVSASYSSAPHWVWSVCVSVPLWKGVVFQQSLSIFTLPYQFSSNLVLQSTAGVGL